MAARSLQIPIIGAGRLLTQPQVSLESVGGDNFSVILNMYRDWDQLVREPGWSKFFPNHGFTVTNQYTFGATPTGTGVAVTTAFFADTQALFNYRSGTVRTGQYHSATVSPFGWLPGPGTITAYHPYDSNHDGMISLPDLLDAITDLGIWGANYPVQIGELVRGDGTRVLLAASQTVIKYFNNSTGAWVTIGSGFSVTALRWQFVALSNVAIFNNGVDIPQTWEIGDAAVAPLYELREAGIASVGRIAAYNGFLFVGDVVEIKSGQLPLWMNGYGSYTSTSNSAKVANFNVTTGDARVRFQVTTGASTITATLPTVGIANYGLYVLIEKVDAGVGTVVTSPVVVDEPLILSAQNDLALLFWNGLSWTAKVFSGGIIPATDPYGIVTATTILQYFPDEQAWSELGQPKNWAPLVFGYLGSAGVTIVLPFKPFNWMAGQTRVAVIGAGEDEGVLGGQTLYPNGILITAFTAFNPATPGVTATLEVTTDTAISYPRIVSVTRWTDVSTFVGKQRMGNGDKITTMFELNGSLMNYQTTGIFITRYTGNAAAPFALRSKYVGNAVPMFGDCVGLVRNSYHLYPALNGSFIMFDGLSDPVIHEMTEGASDLFFAGIFPSAGCWAVDNPMTQQIFFVLPTKVFAYRYQQGSEGVSEIDAAISAGAFVTKPAGTDKWFVLALDRFIYQFGMVNGAPTTWLRDGVSPTIPAQLTSGLNSFKTQRSEKMLKSFTPILASPSPDVAISVQLRSTWNPGGTLSDLLSPAEALPTPDGDNLVLCCFQGNYFQDEIVLTDTRDLDFRISARLFEFDIVGGLTVTRSGNV